MCKNLFISIMKHGFFVLFYQQTQSLITNSMFFPLMFHLTCIDSQTRCVSSKDLSVLMVLMHILIYPHWFLLYPFDKVCWLRVVLIFNAAFTHAHRFQTLSWTWWTRCNDWKAKNCTMSLTGENWWKKHDEMENNLTCAVTDNGRGRVEAGIGSEKFLRIRTLEIFNETLFFGPSS